MRFTRVLAASAIAPAAAASHGAAPWAGTYQGAAHRRLAGRELGGKGITEPTSPGL